MDVINSQTVKSEMGDAKKVTFDLEPKLPPLLPGWKVFGSSADCFYYHPKSGCKTRERPDAMNGHSCGPECASVAFTLKKEIKAETPEEVQSVKTEPGHAVEEMKRKIFDFKRVVENIKTEAADVKVKSEQNFGQLENEISSLKLGVSPSPFKWSLSHAESGLRVKPPGVHTTSLQAAHAYEPLFRKRNGGLKNLTDQCQKMPKFEAPVECFRTGASPPLSIKTELKDTEKGVLLSEGMELETQRKTTALEVAQCDSFVVVTTEILLNDLDLLTQLRDCTFKEVGSPMIAIPWVVHDELDRYCRDSSCTYELKKAAKVAMSFILSSLNSKNRRLIVQDVIAAGSELKGDYILQFCEELIKAADVMILTENQNLATKAAGLSLPSHSARSLRQVLNLPCAAECGGKFDSKANRPRVEASKQPGGDNKEALLPTPQGHVEQMQRALDITGQLFSHILTTEMIEAYGDLWKQVVLHKPPWGFRELMLCLEKHWMVALSGVMQRQAQHLITNAVRHSGLSLRVNARNKCAEMVRICLALVMKVSGQKYKFRRDAAILELEVCLIR